MTNTFKKQGSLQTLRKGGVSRMRETPNQPPPVTVLPWDPYYPQYPPQDHQYILQEPQYILQDPQYMLQDPQQSEMSISNVPPYPYFSPYPPQDVYPPVTYTYGTEPPNMVWGEGSMPFYGDWSQIPPNIHPVAKMEPIEIVEIDEPLMVLGPTQNMNVVSNSKSRGNVRLKTGVKQRGSAGPPKIDILKLAMNKTNVVDHNSIFVEEVHHPIDPVESLDGNSLEQLEHNLASVENSLKHLESTQAYKSPKTVVDIVDSINNRFEYHNETKGGPLENKMNTVLNHLFNEKGTTYEKPVDEIKYSEWIFDDSDLPSGWKTRSYSIIVNGKSTVEHQFLSPNQTPFTSLKSLIEYMKTEAKFSREIMENLIVSKSGTVETEQTLMNSLNSESVEKDNRDNIGSHFNNPDNFIYDETLPSGWKKRSVEVKSNQHKTGKVTRYYYYSNTNDRFTSRSAVVQHMRQSGNYSDEQIVKVLSGRPASVEKMVKVSPGSVKRPADAHSDVENMYKKAKLDNKSIAGHLFSGWMSDNTLPPGWKVRSRQVENDLTMQTDYQYLSPDIKILKSRSDVNEYLNTYKSNVDNVLTNTNENDPPRKSIIQHTNAEESLISNDEHDDEVTDLEKLLLEAANTSKKALANNNVKSPKMLPRSDKSVPMPEQDWEFDESLPNGWKKRSFKRKFKAMGVDKFVTQYQYMSPNGQKFSSRAQVVAHMEQSEKYSKEEVSAVEKGKGNCKGRIPGIKTKDETEADIAKGVKVDSKAKVVKDVKVDSKAKVAKDVKVDSKAKVAKDIKVETPDNEAKINKLMSSKHDRKFTKVDAPVRNSKYKTKPVTTIQSMSTDWVTDDDMLPEGWAKRAYENNNKVKVFQYCNNIHNPRNIFQSKIEVVRFMKNSKRYTLDEVFKFLTGVEKQNDATFFVKEANHFEFECNYCPLQFLTSKEQASHQQQEHAGQFRFKCNECGTGDLKKTSLMYHVRSKHEGDQKGEKITFDLEIPDKKAALIQAKKTAAKYYANLSLQNIKSSSSETTTSETKKKSVDNVSTIKETIDDNISPKIKEDNSKNIQNNEENTNKIKTVVEDQINAENIASNEKSNTVKINTKREPKVEQFYDSEDSSEVKKGTDLVLNSEREAFEFLENISESNMDDDDSDEKMDVFNDDIDKEMSSISYSNIEKNLDAKETDLDGEDDDESSGENNEEIDDLDDFDSQIADIEENIEALTNKAQNMQNDTIPIGPKLTIRMDNFEIISLLFLATPNPIDTMIQDLAEGNNMSVEDVKGTFIKLRKKFLDEDGEEVNREAMQEMVNQLKAKYQSDEYFEF